MSNCISSTGARAVFPLLLLPRSCWVSCGSPSQESQGVAGESCHEEQCEDLGGGDSQ